MNLSTNQQSAAEATRKFLFERSFDAGAVRVPERKPVTLKPDQYDALKKESYDEGFAAGRKAGFDEQTGGLTTLLTQVAAKLDGLAEHMKRMQAENDARVRTIALAIAKKFVPELARRNGVQEIEAVLTEAIAEMVHEPRLVVRVHEGQFDMLNEKINAIATQKAYAGKIVVLADTEIAAGDCRVEWADGGIERNAAKMWDNVEKAVAP